MSDDLDQKKPVNDGQADYGGQKTDKASPDKSDYLNKDKIDALDTDTFDAADYQEDGQGGPRKGLEKEKK